MSAKERRSPEGAGFEDNRAHERVSIDAFVRILGHDREYVFRTRDLSEGGMYLHTRVGHLYPFVVGSELAIEVQTQTHVVSLTGIIARIDTVEREGPVGFALRLDPAPDHIAEILRAILRQARDSA